MRLVRIPSDSPASRASAAALAEYRVRERELRMMRKLSHQLIDVGYRAQALRLHPRHGRWIERGDGATDQGSRLIAEARAWPGCPPVVAWTAQAAADLTALLHFLLQNTNRPERSTDQTGRFANKFL